MPCPPAHPHAQPAVLPQSLSTGLAAPAVLPQPLGTVRPRLPSAHPHVQPEVLLPALLLAKYAEERLLEQVMLEREGVGAARFSHTLQSSEGWEAAP